MPRVSSMFRRQPQPTTIAANLPAPNPPNTGTPGNAERPLSGATRQANQPPGGPPPVGAPRQADQRPGGPPQSGALRSATGNIPAKARPARHRCLNESAHKQLD